MDEPTAPPILTGIDPAADHADFTVYAVVERIFDRRELHGIWVVEFEALDVYEGDHICHQFLLNTAKEAYKFKPGRAVTWCSGGDDFDDGLPF